jgi:hypothetical protein
MRDLEAMMRSLLSILGWVRALSKGYGAVARRGARIKAHQRLAGWMR